MSYKLSSQAVGDIVEIVLYGNDQFGVPGARRYQAGLLATVALLAANPMIGRSAGQIGTSLRRHGYGSHVIFYTPSDQAIVVERIIHMAKLKGWSLNDDLA
ncbi:type II toxin-antitoxin system RelE/ParE family toxin [uncultured Devosia sp.]|uniref:type II toxin-antitoxin system RelE/ParE family toxin n=1 Tax=uncultured Devosia sp. TaxID=211434 RepID=UPI0035CBB8C8